jgi:hypothetical protein
MHARSTGLVSSISADGIGGRALYGRSGFHDVLFMFAKLLFIDTVKEYVDTIDTSTEYVDIIELFRHKPCDAASQRGRATF